MKTLIFTEEMLNEIKQQNNDADNTLNYKNCVNDLIIQLRMERKMAATSDAVALSMIHALERAVCSLERLGDDIGNGEIDPNRKGCLGARCDAISDARRAIFAGRAAFRFGFIPGGKEIDPSSIPLPPEEPA